jgi:prevent-host-death family protein
MVNTISLKALRPELPEVIKHIDSRLDRYIVTKRGKPIAVMMSIEDYESILETMDIQSDKALIRRIKIAEKEVHRGKGTSLEKVQKELGLV